MAKAPFKSVEKLQRLLREVPLGPLTAAHIEDVAKLHYRLLPWSFNGQFGESHIVDLYRALSRSPHFFGYVSYQDCRLVGFVTGTMDFRETRGRIVEVYRRRLGRMCWIFLRHPRFLLAALESKFLVPSIFRRYGTRAEWLTFVTDTGTGSVGPLVAMRLIEAIQEHFQSARVSCYMAQGFKDNPPAMKMYKKLGWRIVATLPMHNIYLYPTTPPLNGQSGGAQ